MLLTFRVCYPAAHAGDLEDAVAARTNSAGYVTVYLVLRDAPAATVWNAERRRSGPAAAQARVRKHLADIDAAHTALRASLVRLGARETGSLRKLANAIRVRVLLDRLGDLAALPGVLRLEEAHSYRAATTTSVPHSGAVWVWTNSVFKADGRGVRVGIIDSGIDYTHADFGGSGQTADFLANDSKVIEPGTFPTAKVVGGYDFAGDDYDSGDPAHDIPQPDADPMDASGHGTAVAGIVGGLGVLRDGRTYTGSYSNQLDSSLFLIGPGMAPGAALYALRVLGRQGFTFLIPDALEWAADPNNDGDFSDRLDVVNISIGDTFGIESTDTLEGAAVNNLALLGCVVVGSAGNSGNTFYITGGPAAASRAISTANLISSVPAIEITEPPSIARNYLEVPAEFGPQLNKTGPVVGRVVYVQPTNACSSVENGAELMGNIALIDRGGCLFVDKIQRAVDAGALAVIMVDNVPGPPIAMTGNGATVLNIPAVMISQADGEVVKGALRSGSVHVRLDASLRADNATVDTVASSSSRGPVWPNQLLKPDISAPGEGVFTAHMGTGTEGILVSGTSIASPHVAGTSALLKQIHPTWPAEDIKAALLNTAAAVQTAGGTVYPESRVGAGRLQVDRAAPIQVTAQADAPDGRVAITFGALELVQATTVTQRVRLTNHGNEPMQFSVAVSNTVSRAGVRVKAPAEQITVLPLSSVTTELQLAADPTVLDRTLDPTTPMQINNIARAGIYEVSGQLWFQNASNSIHLPYYALVRAASDFQSAATVSWPDDASVPATIRLGGRTTHPQPLVSAFQLGYVSGTLNLTKPGDAPADLLAVGAACNAASAKSFTNSMLFFGLVTAASWSTPQYYNVGLVIDIDRNLDGAADATIYNTSAQNLSVTNLISGVDANDVLITAVTVSNDTRLGTNLNFFAPDARDTVLFNTRVLVEPVPVSVLNLRPDQTRLAYRVRTAGNRSTNGKLVDRTPWIVFDAANPGIDTARGLDSTPFYVDGGEVSATVHPDAFASYTQNAAVLLLHHMNTVSNQMEIIRFVPRLSIQPSGGEVVVSWQMPGLFWVQSTSDPGHPMSWQNLSTARSEYRISPGVEPLMFYRLNSNF